MKRKPPPLDQGRAMQRNLLDESTKRVQQLSLPMASGTKADQMPGFDVGGILDPSRTWRPRKYGSGN